MVCAISVLVLSSGAHAYFRASGSGSGTGATGTLQPATLVGIAPKAGGTVTPSLPGCTTSGVSLATIGSLAITLTPGSNTVHISNGATMSTASVSGCQGATFAIDVTITVHQ